MKMLFPLAFAVLCSTPLAYAETKPPVPTGSESRFADDLERWLAFFDKLVDIVVADQDSCPKMATDLDKHIDANAALLARMQEAGAKKQKLPQDAQAHLESSAKKMAPALQKCGRDKGVQAAFLRLRTAPAGK